MGKNNKKAITFKATPVKCVYNSDDFKVYAMNVDVSKYPSVKLNRFDNVSISGNLPVLTTGVEYDIVATEEQNNYGYTYKVKSIGRDMLRTDKDVLKFLRSITNEEKADVLYSAYPDIVQRVMDDNLDDIDLSRTPGIKEKTFNTIREKIVVNYVLFDLVNRFNGILTMPMLKRIHEIYPSVQNLMYSLKMKPYSTLVKINGVGFKKADEMVLKMQKEGVIDFGYDINTSVDRCLACVIYILQKNESEGNTRANLADVRRECLNLVPACVNNFVKAIQDDAIYYNKVTMSIALRSTYDAEKRIAETIACCINDVRNVWRYDIEKYRNINNVIMSDEQMSAIRNVCEYSISILNGPAGSGKSFSVQAIIKMLDDYDKTYLLLAPTGKAARVISEYTGKQAKTIHRGLEYIPGKGWGYKQNNKLKEDVVIIDEFSMCDVHLFANVVDAINFNKTKLVVIGDNAQLPSVGCGNLLHDFMKSNIIPAITLTHIFRYSDGGLMKVATDTRMCRQFLNNTMSGKVTNFGVNKDYVFIDTRSEDIPANVVALYCKLINNGNRPDDVQVLTAKNVGDCGTIMLNNMIQKAINKNYGSSNKIEVGETTYYEGDIVIQTQSNYNAEICDRNYKIVKMFDNNGKEVTVTKLIANGESGVIKRIRFSNIIIDFNGILVSYDKCAMNTVKLGYSISIFKAQGSSIKNVILCTPKSHTFMLNNNLLYTGLTRTVKRCYHFGTVKTVNIMVAKKENLMRNTFMQELLKQTISESTDE